MNRTEAPIYLAGSHLGEARHVCAFFNSREDEYRVTLPFIKDGFDRGDKVIHVVDPSRRDDLLRRLASSGIDPNAKQQTGQLAVHDWSETFFIDGAFDPDRQVDLLDQTLRNGREQGFPVCRYVADAEWVLQTGASIDLLLEFEAKVNQMWPRNADTVICTYDLARFDADTVIDAFRTHAVVIIGGILQQNPFFVQPDDFLREVGERRRRRQGSSPAL